VVKIRHLRPAPRPQGQSLPSITLIIEPNPTRDNVRRTGACRWDVGDFRQRTMTRGPFCLFEALYRRAREMPGQTWLRGGRRWSTADARLRLGRSIRSSRSTMRSSIAPSTMRFLAYEKSKRDRCSPHVHGSCRMCSSRSVEFGLRLNLCQLDQSSHVRA
jgi:hypothetical protein